MKHNPKHIQHGFTIMELMVSIAIVSFMLFLINRIFFDTAEAVSRGIATSKIISNTRTIGEQLENDSALMQGPSTNPSDNAGFIIIVNKKYEHIPYLDGRDKSGIIEGNSFTTGGRPVRSDQLCFVRKADGTNPITTTDSTSGYFTGTSAAQYGRVWYGHVRQISEDGSLETDLGMSGTPDAYATNWVLGRQLLFLDGATTDDTYCTYTSSTPWTVASHGPFYNGYSDVLKKNLRDGSTGILDNLEATTSRTSYVSLLYSPTNLFYVFPSSFRLAVRTTPTLSQVDAANIAQMHPYFMNNVSDFIVEFAGDYSPKDNLVDLNGSNIKWYGLSDVLPDASGEPFDKHPVDDPITDPVNNSNPYLARGNSSVNTDTERVFVFFHNDTTYWPKMLRIRYRLHDPKGDLLGTADENPEDGILDDEGQPGKWFEVIIQVPN